MPNQEDTPVSATDTALNSTVDPIPLALYIHLPWCLRKCPYCDFNSHEFADNFPEDRYVNALIEDAKSQRPLVENRIVDSIFFGGGTPSLFSSHAIDHILDACKNIFSLSESVEITLEANPGAVDQERFRGYRSAGVNRLSIGVQSFSTPHLKSLGRIHSANDADAAIRVARQAKFENINIDLMYGLPEQSLPQALSDLRTAFAYQPEHISYYQLTIEPNTFFAKHPPKLNDDDLNHRIQEQSITLLQQHGYARYEVSAYSRPQRESRHNLNYWQFGDYLGLGAGAHGKITSFSSMQIIRTQNKKMPQSYIQAIEQQLPYQKCSRPLSTDDLQFEFLLNALRLTAGIDATTYRNRTFLQWNPQQPAVKTAIKRGLLTDSSNHICTTDVGYCHLNDTLALFLPDS